MNILNETRRKDIKFIFKGITYKVIEITIKKPLGNSVSYEKDIRLFVLTKQGYILVNFPQGELLEAIEEVLDDSIDE